MKGKDRIAGYKLIGKLPVLVFDVLEWAIWFEANPEARLVAKTMVGPLTVSTVFLGFDHGRGDRTMLFETMVFGAGDHLVELVPGRKRLFCRSLDYGDRYETWGEAEAGHAKAVAWAQGQLAQIDATIAISPACRACQRP